MAKLKRNFTEGPLFFRIALFALPIMANGILQVFYNMADNMVVGKFSNEPFALAAVGSTGPVTSLIINLFLGITIGAGIISSQLFGANKTEEVSKASHTAMTFSIIIGLALGFIGFVFAPQILSLMGVREEYKHLSVLYLRIIMCGLPASSIYNFGAAIVRSVGDSKTPVIILSLSGLLNVGLNLFFVLVLKMTVDGVALATIISQYLSAFFIIFAMVKRKDMPYALNLKKLKINKELLKKMLRIGIPSAIQSSMFSFANMAIMSAVNTFPATVVSAYTIAANIEGLTYTAMHSYQQTTITFTGQNYGANKPVRIKKVFAYSIAQVAFVGILVGQLELLFGNPLISLYVNSSDPNIDLVIPQAMSLMKIMLTFYFLCGIMEIISGALRGLGCSIIPMIVSLIGACVFRLVWIYGIFFPLDIFSTIEELIYCYPLSWILTIIAHLTTLIVYWKKFGILKKKNIKKENC